MHKVVVGVILCGFLLVAFLLATDHPHAANSVTAYLFGALICIVVYEVVQHEQK